MAVKCSSGATSTAMKASLVLMLLFGAVVAAQAEANPMTFVNKTCAVIIVNGVVVLPGTTKTLPNVVDRLLNVTVGTVTYSWTVPVGAKEITFTYVNGVLTVIVTAATGILGQLLDIVLRIVVVEITVVLGCL